MEEIIERILQKLQQREQQLLSVQFGDGFSFDSACFLSCKNIHVRAVPVLMLKKLTDLQECDFVNWVLEGITFEVMFHFYLAETACSLVPVELLTKWPIRLYDEHGRRIQAFSRKAITYSEAALLTEGSILLRLPGQLITGLADEVIEKKQIKLIERF